MLSGGSWEGGRHSSSGQGVFCWQPVVDLNRGGALSMRFGAGHAHTRHIKIQQLRATTFVFAQKKLKNESQTKKKELREK